MNRPVLNSLSVVHLCLSVFICGSLNLCSSSPLGFRSSDFIRVHPCPSVVKRIRVIREIRVIFSLLSPLAPVEFFIRVPFGLRVLSVLIRS